MVAVRLPSKGYPVSEPLVIIGNGMTAARLVDELTRYALARHAIGVIGDERQQPELNQQIAGDNGNSRSERPHLRRQHDRQYQENG